MKRIEVVAAVIEHDGKFLATQRGYGAYKDKWEFPGGKIETGESRREALRREIREELEVDVEVGELICTVECDYAEFHLTMHAYLCRATGRLQLVEAEDARWLDRAHLTSVDWLPADLDVVEKLLL